MPSSPLPAFFTPGQAIPSYLAAWRQAFDALAPDHSLPVELWFDRGAGRPVVETVRIPRHADVRLRRLSVLYLAVLINNTLCTQGAARVTLASRPAEVARDLVMALQKSLILWPDCFSNMSLRFLHGLIHRVYGAPLAIDADPEQVRVLRDRCRPSAPTPFDPVGPPRPGTVLAMNIGQHLTRLALVRLDGRGGHAVMDLTCRDTWPAGTRPCLVAAWERLLAEAGRVGAASGERFDAVGISVAATTRHGMVEPVPGFGLFAASSPEDCRDFPATLRRACARHFPGHLATLVNDGEAQALFAFHYSHPCKAKGTPEGDMASVRLGACPAVHRLDARGTPLPGLHEYGWLVTRYAPDSDLSRLFATIRLYLSHYGVATVAHELGFLDKHQVPPEAAIPFFHEALLCRDHPASQDAARIYGVLGAQLAMLIHELHRHRPLASVRLLGSRANRLDAVAFAAMANGFAAFADRYGLSLGGIRLDLLANTSSIAGLVGAAHAALDRSPARATA